jgi:hypothetical protein
LGEGGGVREGVGGKEKGYWGGGMGTHLGGAL